MEYKKALANWKLFEFLDLAKKILVGLTWLAVLIIVADLTASIYQIYFRPVKSAKNEATVIKGTAAPFLFSDIESTFKSRSVFGFVESLEVASVRITEARIDLKLNGIFLGKKRRAALQNSATGQSYLAAEGDVIENLKIKEIKEQKVILERGTETMEIAIESSSRNSVSGAAANVSNSSVPDNQPNESSGFTLKSSASRDLDINGTA